MTATTIKKRQRSSSFLSKTTGFNTCDAQNFKNVDKDAKRINRKQHNKEINDAVKRIEKEDSMAHKEALKERSKW
jgi:hypothetical protein